MFYCWNHSTLTEIDSFDIRIWHRSKKKVGNAWNRTKRYCIKFEEKKSNYGCHTGVYVCECALCVCCVCMEIWNGLIVLCMHHINYKVISPWLSIPSVFFVVYSYPKVDNNNQNVIKTCRWQHSVPIEMLRLIRARTQSPIQFSLIIILKTLKFT